MEKRTVIDQMMRTVEVPIKPERIVSLVPSQTELLHYFGLENEVVGITKFCVYPREWFNNKMRIGGTKHLKIKEIIDLNPDLVIGNKEENTKEDIQQLERNGITVWMSDINSFDEALSMIQQIGSIFSKDRESKQLCANILNGFHKLKDVGKSQRVLYFIWDEPSIVVGKNTFINAIIELLGFVNTCYLNRYPYLDQLSNIHPDFVFLSSEPFPFSKVHIEKFQKLFPNSKVIPVDGEMFSWYGSRMQLALKYFSSNAFE